MRRLLSVLAWIGYMLLSTSVFAQAETTNTVNHNLIFQVIQDQFVLDNSTIKSATIIEGEGGIYKGLNIQLKPEAAATFTEISKAGVGRKLNLVYNNVVITTSVIQDSLGDNFLISGISKQDAQAFLNVLNANKPKKEEPTG